MTGFVENSKIWFETSTGLYASVEFRDRSEAYRFLGRLEQAFPQDYSEEISMSVGEDGVLDFELSGSTDENNVQSLADSIEQQIRNMELE